MRWQGLILAAFACMISATAASAQTATATGVGVGIANSRSSSSATAIGGGNATGGAGVSSSSLVVNNAAQPATTTANVNENATIRNVPAVFAPGLTAAGLETCLGSVSGGGSVVGFGATFGTTVPDPQCAARLDARTLWSFGLRKAAVIRLCLMPDIYRSMPEVCDLYMPRYGYAAPGVAPAAYAAGYAGGPIEVIEQKSGRRRLCMNLDVTRHRCRVWAREQMAAAH